MRGGCDSRDHVLARHGGWPVMTYKLPPLQLNVKVSLPCIKQKPLYMLAITFGLLMVDFCFY